MSIKVKLILTGIIGMILFIALDGKEYVREVLNPVGYWTEKRDESQENVMLFQNQVGFCLLEFKKLIHNRNITIKQALISGSTPQEAKEEYLAELEVTKVICDTMRKILSKAEADLQYANEQLANHQ